MRARSRKAAVKPLEQRGDWLLAHDLDTDRHVIFKRSGGNQWRLVDSGTPEQMAEVWAQVRDRATA